MSRRYPRRDFLKQAAGFTAGIGLLPLACQPDAPPASEVTSKPIYTISLAQWSLHKALFGGELDNLDFARTARDQFGIEAVEYVNQFFKDRARDQAYLQDMKQRAADAGVQSLLIMCDGEGALGDPNEQARLQAVENHEKWLEAAQFLGCHSIRVNAASEGSLSFEEQQNLAADGLRRLAERADGYGLNVLVENHGGLSSNGQWLAGVMKLVDHPRIGTLPDFGNFRIREGEMYDRYQGVQELMPYAKAVSAKSHNFDENGNEVDTDFHRMMEIVLDAGYRGWVGVEYEGNEMSEADGILATKALLERVRTDLAGKYS